MSTKKKLAYAALIIAVTACAKSARKRDRRLAAAGWSRSRTNDLAAGGERLKREVDDLASLREEARRTGEAVQEAMDGVERFRGSLAKGVRAINGLRARPVAVEPFLRRALGHKASTHLAWIASVRARLEPIEAALRPLVGARPLAELSRLEEALADAVDAHEESKRALAQPAGRARATAAALTRSLQTLITLVRSVFHDEPAVVAEFSVRRKPRRRPPAVAANDDAESSAKKAG